MRMFTVVKVSPAVLSDISRCRCQYPNGICGVCAIAMATGNNLSAAMLAWDLEFGGPYVGHSTVHDLLRLSGRLGFCLKRRGRGSVTGYLWPVLEPDEVGFGRIVWGNPADPEGSWHHWVEAMRHTHYVSLCGENGRTFIFCDGGNDWFDAGSYEGQHYLDGLDKLMGYYILQRNRT